MRANVLWRALEAAAGEKLLVQNGGLILLDSAGGVQGPGAAFFNQTVDCARRFGIEHEMLGAEEIRQRTPRSSSCKMALKGIWSRAPAFSVRRNVFARSEL